MHLFLNGNLAVYNYNMRDRKGRALGNGYVKKVIKKVYFRNVLLKMFTFVRHYMNFIFSKVLSILRLFYKIITHSVCTD